MTPRQRLTRQLAEALEAAQFHGAIKLKLYQEAKQAGVAEERSIARAEALARKLARTPE